MLVYMIVAMFIADGGSMILDSLSFPKRQKA